MLTDFMCLNLQFYIQVYYSFYNIDEIFVVSGSKYFLFRRRVRKSLSTDTDFQNYQHNSPQKRMVEDDLSDHIDYDEHGIDDFD